VRQLVADEMPRSSRRDRPRERRRDDSQFVLDVRESAVAASRGEPPRRGLEENQAGRLDRVTTDENLMTRTGTSLDPWSTAR